MRNAFGGSGSSYPDRVAAKRHSGVVRRHAESAGVAFRSAVGKASGANEIAAQSGIEIRLEDGSIPVRDEVRGACELLGLDPMFVANEGKLVAIIAPEAADAVLQAMRSHPLGGSASIAGTVRSGKPGLVNIRTPFGSTRIVAMLAGDQLPGIC